VNIYIRRQYNKKTVQSFKLYPIKPTHVGLWVLKAVLFKIRELRRAKC